MIRIYMDDIAIATKSPSLSLHTDAVSNVLRVAQENLLFFKLAKSIFHAPEIDYLGVILGKKGTRMDPAKVSGVRSWPTVKKQPSQGVLHGDEAEEELGLARLVSSYTLPHQNSQPGERGRQMARSKVLSRRARDT